LAHVVTINGGTLAKARDQHLLDLDHDVVLRRACDRKLKNELVHALNHRCGDLVTRQDRDAIALAYVGEFFARALSRAGAPAPLSSEREVRLRSIVRWPANVVCTACLTIRS
jgi:hypothetical protein